MADERTAKVMLEFETNRDAVARAKRTIEELEQRLKGTDEATKRVSKSLQEMQRAAQIERIGTSFGRMSKQIKDTQTATEGLVRALNRVGATQPEIERATAAFAGAGAGGQKISPALGAFGVTLRNQPAIATPLGVSTDAIAKLLALFGNLPPLAFPVIAALAGIGVAFVALETQTMNAKKAIEAATLANKAYFELIAEGAGSAEAKKRVEELNRTLAANREELATIKNAFEAAFGNAKEQFAGIGEAGQRLLYGLGQISSADDALVQRADELTTAIRNNEAEVARLTGALEAGAFAEADYRKQIEETNKIRTEASLAGASDEFNRQLKLQRERAMTSSQLMSQITTATQEQNAAQSALNKLLADKANGVKGLDEQIAAYEVQLGRLGGDLSRLYELFADRKAIEEATRIRTESIEAVRKYNADLAKIEEQAGQARVAAADKYLDAISKASEQAAEAAADALRKLQEKREDLDRDLARDEADAALKASQERQDAQLKLQREETEAYQEHYRNIQKIIRDGQRDERTAIENRDAVALARARENTASRLEDANEEFANERAKKQDALRQQLQDLDVAQRRDRERRLLKYRRDLEDAQIAYSRDLQLSQQRYNAAIQLAQQAYQREIQLAQQKHNAELQARSQAIQAELNLIKQGLEARLAMERNYWVQAQYIQNLSNPRPVPPPTGNPLTGPLLLNRPNQSTSLSFAPTINGSSRNAIQRQIVTSLDQFLTKAGIN